MDIKFQDQQPERIKAGLLAVPVREKQLDGPVIRRLDRLLHGGLVERIKKSQFTGAEGASLSYSTAGRIPAANLALIGLGKTEEINADSWRKAGARARKEAAALGAEEVGFFFAPEKESETAAGAVAEGVHDLPLALHLVVDVLLDLRGGVLDHGPVGGIDAPDAQRLHAAQ